LGVSLPFVVNFNLVQLHFFLPVIAGGFIYIAGSDLVPLIKEQKSFKKSCLFFGAMIAGSGLMYLFFAFRIKINPNLDGTFFSKSIKGSRTNSCWSIFDLPRGSSKSWPQKASRAVGQILAQNYNSLIPCHRVIKNNYEVGGYHGSFKNSYQKVGLLLKEGALGVIPTDTIYGICGSALKKEVVEKIYRLRKRNFKKPMIILISSINDLQYFRIRLNPFQKRILKQLWPGSVSVILKCPLEKFSYLHRGIKTLALRMPHDQELLKILRISGPLVAPSANFEGEKPAATIKEAKRYFQAKVFIMIKGHLFLSPQL